MSEINLKELLESGAHFGHQTRRWNPKMGPFIYGVKGGIHIFDLVKTADCLSAAEKFVHDIAARGGSVLFVGTKRQAKNIVRDEARRIDMPYVTERWLGGMLTNHRTIRAQVNRLKKLESQVESGELAANYNKKEALDLTNEIKRLNFIFGGIKDMDVPPAALFIIDSPRENIAVLEAIKLGIPIVAVTDTNADPDLIDYPIPANDDAIKTIALVTKIIADAVSRGRAVYQANNKSGAEAEVNGAGVEKLKTAANSGK